MIEYPGYDFREPNYALVFRKRLAALKWLRENPEAVPDLKGYYKENLAAFISDWGVTFDPRNADIGLPSLIPLVLFPKQIEFIEYIVACWKARIPGLIEKSRDVGATWCAAELGVGICLFYPGAVIGFGSKEKELVDNVGTMKPILPKCRMFIEHLPEEFRGGVVLWRDAPQFRINFPETGSIITGQVGDNIGRGDRTSIFFVDEAAHLERPLLVDAALSQTTNCRVEMSSVNGMQNPFARRRWEGKIEPFIFDWRDDPRKDDAWYQKQCAELDPVVVAQEIDRDYSASVQNIIIPGAWVRASIDACDKLGITPVGEWSFALDLADEGNDKNALVGGRGVEIGHVEEWSGKGSDLFQSVEHAFDVCDAYGVRRLRYDADGLGANVRGDARVINEGRRRLKASLEIVVEAFHGSGQVMDKEKTVEPDLRSHDRQAPKNKDFFQNFKAQAWWDFRRRFRLTYRWVTTGVQCDPDDIISISSKAPGYMKLVGELSQPTRKVNHATGRMIVDKKPDGSKSPNLADGAMMRSARVQQALAIPGNFDQLIRQAAAQARRR